MSSLFFACELKSRHHYQDVKDCIRTTLVLGIKAFLKSFGSYSFSLIFIEYLHNLQYITIFQCIWPQSCSYKSLKNKVSIILDRKLTGPLMLWKIFLLLMKMKNTLSPSLLDSLLHFGLKLFEVKFEMWGYFYFNLSQNATQKQ